MANTIYKQIKLQCVHVVLHIRVCNKRVTVYDKRVVIYDKHITIYDKHIIYI